MQLRIKWPTKHRKAYWSLGPLDDQNADNINNKAIFFIKKGTIYRVQKQNFSQHEQPKGPIGLYIQLQAWQQLLFTL